MKDFKYQKSTHNPSLLYKYDFSFSEITGTLMTGVCVIDPERKNYFGYILAETILNTFEGSYRIESYVNPESIKYYEPTLIKGLASSCYDDYQMSK